MDEHQHLLLTDQRRPVRVIGYPSLSLERNRFDRMLSAGQSVDDYLHCIWARLDGVHARVFIDGQLIERAEWGTTRPEPGQSVMARLIPTGGGDGGKQIMRIVMLLAIVAGAIYAPWALGMTTTMISGTGAVSTVLTGWGSALTAGLTIAGSLAMTARIPPARPRLGDQRPVLHG
jgi:hypothetical protein